MLVTNTAAGIAAGVDSRVEPNLGDLPPQDVVLDGLTRFEQEQAALLASLQATNEALLAARQAALDALAERLQKLDTKDASDPSPRRRKQRAQRPWLTQPAAAGE